VCTLCATRTRFTSCSSGGSLKCGIRGLGPGCEASPSGSRLPTTGKMRDYIVNYCDAARNTGSPGTVSVIDGATDTVQTTLTAGIGPMFAYCTVTARSARPVFPKESDAVTVNCVLNVTSTLEGDDVDAK
jgi:DNA-binding beta-propeller fold protein YncE